MLLTGCATSVQREIEASIDASVEADRRQDFDERPALFTPDMTLETLSGAPRAGTVRQGDGRVPRAHAREKWRLTPRSPGPPPRDATKFLTSCLYR
jgi:hypothetical protein